MHFSILTDNIDFNINITNETEKNTTQLLKKINNLYKRYQKK